MILAELFFFAFQTAVTPFCGNADWYWRYEAAKPGRQRLPNCSLHQIRAIWKAQSKINGSKIHWLRKGSVIQFSGSGAALRRAVIPEAENERMDWMPFKPKPNFPWFNVLSFEFWFLASRKQTEILRAISPMVKSCNNILYPCVQDNFEELQSVWDDRFASRDGYWHPMWWTWSTAIVSSQ